MKKLLIVLILIFICSISYAEKKQNHCLTTIDAFLVEMNKIAVYAGTDTWFTCDNAKGDKPVLCVLTNDSRFVLERECKLIECAARELSFNWHLVSNSYKVDVYDSKRTLIYMLRIVDDKLIFTLMDEIL